MKLKLLGALAAIALSTGTAHAATGKMDDCCCKKDKMDKTADKGDQTGTTKAPDQSEHQHQH